MPPLTCPNLTCLLFDVFLRWLGLCLFLFRRCGFLCALFLLNLLLGGSLRDKQTLAECRDRTVLSRLNTNRLVGPTRCACRPQSSSPGTSALWPLAVSPPSSHQTGDLSGRFKWQLEDNEGLSCLENPWRLSSRQSFR